MSSPKKNKLLPKQTKPYFEVPPPPPPSVTHEVSFRPLTLCILPLLGIVGFYLLYGLGFAGGLFQTITEVINDPDPIFPGTKTPLLVRYTGIGVIDQILKHLVPFFAPIVDYRSVPMTMFWITMIGQIGAGFALFFLEAARRGNQWRPVSLLVIPNRSVLLNLDKIC